MLPALTELTPGALRPDWYGVSGIADTEWFNIVNFNGNHFCFDSFYYYIDARYGGLLRVPAVRNFSVLVLVAQLSP